MRAVVYLRISSDRTGEEAGVTRQREDCLRRCQDRGWDVLAVEQDNDISASSGRKRPGFEAMLAAIDKGEVQAVVAWALDRLQRNRRDELRLYELCQERGVTVSLVRGPDLEWSTPAGRMLADVLGATARMEVEQKSDRQKRAYLQAAQQGRRVGGRRPFGYGVQIGTKVGRTGEEEPYLDYNRVREDEAELIRSGYDALLSGVSLAAIAREWNAAGHHTPQVRRGSVDPANPDGPRIGAGEPSPWTPNGVRIVLENPRYAGFRGHGSVPKRGRRRITTMHPAIWPAIVPEETWRAAVELLSSPARRTAPRSGRALLSGLGLCGVCGSTVHGGRNPQGQRTYRCRVATGGHIVRRADVVDEWVSEVMVARLSRPDAAELLTDHERPDAAELAARAVALRTRLGNLAELVADGTLDPAAARAASARVRAELADAEAEMADAGRADVLGPLVHAEDVRAAWDALATDRRRAVVALLARVELLPPGRGTRTFRPETVKITPRS